MLKVGKKIGEYTLIEHIDSGGSGEVWKAVKRSAYSETNFAIKFFLLKDNQGIAHEKVKEKVAEKVKKEADIWKKLSGLSNIISVIEADKFENYIYIVSEYADGGTLKEWISAKGGKDSSPERAVEIALEILKGLENMHRLNFIHRDLKPANILKKKNVFCLTDFGISREIQTHSEATGTAGTYQYMPPEAFLARPYVSFHTDIWAAGVILQEMLTGQPPFYQQMPSLASAITNEEPEPMPADIPKSLHEIVGKALQKKREDRFASAREMRESLIEFIKEQKTIIDPDDFVLRKAVENFIAICHGLASNPKKIINILSILHKIKSYEEFKEVFSSPNFEGIKDLPGKGQSAKPKRRIVYLAISIVAISAIIIGTATITRIYLPNSNTTQTVNNQNIAGEIESGNYNNNSNGSSKVGRGSGATPKTMRKTLSSPTPKISESPTPTPTSANPSQSPGGTNELPPSPKPPAPMPKQSPTASQIQTSGRNTNN